MATETFHVLHPTRDDVALPTTFHLSREIMEDEGTPAETLAILLHDDLVLAIEHHRARLRG